MAKKNEKQIIEDISKLVAEVTLGDTEVSKKKKTKKSEYTSEDIPLIATDAKSFRNKKTNGSWPKVVRGTHLTVYTFENGTTKLEWDDEALLKEIQSITIVKEKKANKKTTKKTKA